MNKVNHSWLYGVVKPHFDKKGFVLLRDDMLFIEKCLENIPQERHRFVLRDYLAIWDTNVAKNDNVDSTAVNPRFEANTFLRNVSGIE